MNTERLFNVVLLELTTDKMKLEDRLEQTINSSEPIENKVMSIKAALAGISNNELSIAKLQSMLNNNNNDNNIEQKND
jgi:hypothetical protein